MIDRILDNYFSKKLIDAFKSTAIIRGIGLHIIPRKEEITIYAKDRRFAENYYKEVFSFRKEASIYYLSNIIEAQKEFDTILKAYQDKEVR